jgi:hypothetical protein
MMVRKMHPDSLYQDLFYPNIPNGARIQETQKNIQEAAQNQLRNPRKSP